MCYCEKEIITENRLDALDDLFDSNRLNEVVVKANHLKDLVMYTHSGYQQVKNNFMKKTIFF